MYLNSEKARIPTVSSSQEPEAVSNVALSEEKTVSPVIDGETGAPLEQPKSILEQLHERRPEQIKFYTALIQKEAIYAVCEHLEKQYKELDGKDAANIDKQIGYCRAITDIYNFLKSPDWQEAAGNV